MLDRNNKISLVLRIEAHVNILDHFSKWNDQSAGEPLCWDLAIGEPWQEVERNALWPV